MGSKHWLARMVASLMVVFGTINVASAQDDVRGDVAAAITWNQFPDNSGPGSYQTFLDLGWAVSAARPLAGPLSMAGEVGVSSNLLASETTHRSESNRVYAALAGPRATSPRFHRNGHSPSGSRIFAQLLAGGQTGDVFSGGRALQPGAGIDFKTRRGYSVRVQWDHTFVRGQHAISQSRWLTGVVIDVTEQ